MNMQVFTVYINTPPNYLLLVHGSYALRVEAVRREAEQMSQDNVFSLTSRDRTLGKERNVYEKVFHKD